MKKRILLFNFFAGILRRGIPLYVENLSTALRNRGYRCYEIRCPKLFSRLPRLVTNALFVLAEQFLVPIAGLAFDRVIYPYNSVSVFGAFSNRSSVIVHDLIPNHLRDQKISARYIRSTQRLYAQFGGDVIYASQGTMRVAQRVRQFPSSHHFCFPNAFYRLVTLRSDPPPSRQDFVLLCSGWGKHKNLSGALEIYRQSGLYQRRPLRILGLAEHTGDVELFCAKHPEVVQQITTLPALSDAAVVHSYETAAWIWVHSLREGYRRSLAEARLCGGRVVASDIAPFREQADAYTFLYSGLNEFQLSVASCESAPANAPRRSHIEHDQLMAEMQRFISISD